MDPTDRGGAPAAEIPDRQRTVLRAPRVEFDLSALALGAGGWLAYQWSWPALAAILSVPEVDKVPSWLGLRTEFFQRTLAWTGMPFREHVLSLVGASSIVRPGERPGELRMFSIELPWWKYVVVAAWLLVLWSIVAGSIGRVYAVRMARDRSIGASEGLAFAFGNLRELLLAPLFVLAAAGTFLAVGAFAGAVVAIPVAGPFLQIALQPLAILAALAVTLFAIGGIFGFPILQAAIATERNGFLDAVSRTFSYVFTRPLTYLVSMTLVVLIASVVAAFGAAMIAIALRSMSFGASWAADASAPHDAVRALRDGTLFAQGPAAVLGWPQVDKASGVDAMRVYVAWAVTAFASIVIHGFVLSYFVGGIADTYFLLRKEVDGIDEGEVYVEGEEATLGEPLPGEPRP